MILKNFVKSFFVSIIISLSLLLILSILLAKTSISEEIMPVRNYFCFIDKYFNRKFLYWEKYEK